jgi:uncharacterized membrane protein
MIKIVCIILPLIGLLLPLWVLEFNAPMFGARWLRITLYGYGAVEGPLDQINIANHYVGLPEIDPATMIEVRLLPLFFPVIGVLNGLIVFTKKRIKQLFIVSILVVLAIPIYFQYWLYNYGHSIGGEAPVKIEPFTPPVMGSYTIANFNAVAYFHVGFWIIVASLILVYATSIYYKKKL